jgi:hypothetical protein
MHRQYGRGVWPFITEAVTIFEGHSWFPMPESNAGTAVSVHIRAHTHTAFDGRPCAYVLRTSRLPSNPCVDVTGWKHKSQFLVIAFWSCGIEITSPVCNDRENEGSVNFSELSELRLSHTYMPRCSYLVQILSRHSDSLHRKETCDRDQTGKYYWLLAHYLKSSCR